MCYSRANGGQRCYSHAKQRAARASALFTEALASEDDTRIAKATAVYRFACAELASTPQGADEIAALQARVPDEHDQWQAVLHVGETIRDRNEFLRTLAVARASDTPHPLADLTDAPVIENLTRAAESVAADPNHHVNLTQRVKRVKSRFRSEDEKAASVQRWSQTLESRAFSYASLTAQNQAADDFTNALDRLEAMPGDADLSTAVASLMSNPPSRSTGTRPSGAVAAELHDEREPDRKYAREAALAVVITAARLNQAANQPVRP